MAKKKMPHSIRKHIRKEKSRIRRQVLDIKEQNKKIEELYKKYEPRREISISAESTKSNTGTNK